MLIDELYDIIKGNKNITGVISKPEYNIVKLDDLLPSGVVPGTIEADDYLGRLYLTESKELPKVMSVDDGYSAVKKIKASGLRASGLTRKALGILGVGYDILAADLWNKNQFKRAMTNPSAPSGETSLKSDDRNFMQRAIDKVAGSGYINSQLDLQGGISNLQKGYVSSGMAEQGRSYPTRTIQDQGSTIDERYSRLKR